MVHWLGEVLTGKGRMLGGEGPYVKLEQAKATCYCEFLGIESLPQIKEFPLEKKPARIRKSIYHVRGY